MPAPNPTASQGRGFGPRSGPDAGPRARPGRTTRRGGLSRFPLLLLALTAASAATGCRTPAAGGFACGSADRMVRLVAAADRADARGPAHAPPTGSAVLLADAGPR